MVRVTLPPLLRDLAGETGRLRVEARTVGDLVAALDARIPGLGPRLLAPDGRLRPFLTLVAEGRVVGRDPATRLPAPPSGQDLDVWFLVAVAGG